MVRWDKEQVESQGSMERRNGEYWSMSWAVDSPWTYVVKSQCNPPTGHTGRMEERAQSPLDREETEKS